MANKSQENSSHFKSVTEVINHPDRIIIDGRVKFPVRMVTQEQVDAVLNMVVDPSDIFIASYPKCGTTWTQAIVWWIINVQKILSNGGKIDTLVPPTLENLKGSHHRFVDLFGVNDLDKIPKPRVLVTHLPFDLVPKSSPGDQKMNQRAKYIHVIRDPKDAVISFFYMIKGMYNVPDSDIGAFIDHFINGNTLYCDYFDTVRSYWDQRNDPNMLVLFYENILIDPRKEIIRIAEFLSDGNVNYDIILKSSPSIVDKIISETSFKSMKDSHDRSINEGNESLVNFYRKGMKGDYGSSMSIEQINAINDRIKNELDDIFVEMYVN